LLRHVVVTKFSLEEINIDYQLFKRYKK